MGGGKQRERGRERERERERDSLSIPRERVHKYQECLLVISRILV
jgi:hypothetical protein